MCYNCKRLFVDLEHIGYNELFRKSNYVLPGTKTYLIKKKNYNLGLVYFNVESLQKHMKSSKI